MLKFVTLGAAQITPAALIYPCMNEPKARVVAIAARHPDKAQRFADAHHIRTVLENYDDAVTFEPAQAVYNPLHIPGHHPWTIKALNAGKHVLCEKSLASNAIEAEQMAVLASEKRLILMDAFHYRYHPLFERVRELFHSGDLGDIHELRASFSVPVTDPENIRLNYALGGGVTMDIGCYPISWIRHLTNEEPKVVSATAEVGPPMVDLMLEAHLEVGDIKATILGDMRPTARFKAALTVTGSRGSLQVDNIIAPQMGHQLTVEVDGKLRNEVFDRRPTYCYQLDAFIEAVNAGEPPLTDGWDGVKQMRVIDRCYEAAGLPIRGLTNDAA